MVSSADLAKRALVTLIKLLATAYRCVLDVTRDSSDQEVTSAYRKLSKKVHPDKGGLEADQKRLNNAYEKWRKEVRKAPGHGGARVPEPAAAANVPGSLASASDQKSKRQEYRMSSEAVLLTFQSFGDVSRWQRFVSWVKASFSSQFYSACKEVIKKKGAATRG